MPSKDLPNNSPYPQTYWEIAGSFQRSRAFLTAVELGLFSALGDGEKTSQSVASAIGADPRATDRLMNALAAADLLEKREDLFANTPEGRQFLVPGSPDYLAGLMHQVHLWDSWSTLTEAVRKGGSVFLEPPTRGEDWSEAFISAMHDRARRAAPGLVGLVDLSGVARVLDVGGGSGAYAAAFAKARDGIRATVFDLPDVLPITRRFLEREGAQDRVDTAAGDYLEDPLPAGFDLALLLAILHSNSPEENQLLIRKCAGALNPGGRLIVQEFFMAEDRTGPPHSALFALNMLVGTDRGDTYTMEEVKAWMKSAGFTEFERRETGPITAILIGSKAK